MTTLGETPNALPVGTRLHEFEVERILGEGGFAIVYLAFDHSLHRRIALKEYLPAEYAFRHDSPTISIRSVKHRTTFDAGLRSFIEEARFLAQFEHPSLVKVHRVLEDNGTAYMAQGYYEGGTLRATIKANPAFATQAALNALALPLLGAVELLHSRQCIHRDIAPDNIIVQPNGVPVLLDFGAARRIIGDMTQALTAILKPSYAPIEQYTEEAGLAQGPWTDVYALAAVLRAAITGKPPPAAPGRAVNDTLVPFLRSPPAGYDLRFLNGIDAGLAVLPRDRPQSIAAFRDALGLVADGPRRTTGRDVRSTIYVPATTRTVDFAPALAPDARVPPVPTAARVALPASHPPDTAPPATSGTLHAVASPSSTLVELRIASPDAGGLSVAAPVGAALAMPSATNSHVADEAVPAHAELESRLPIGSGRGSIDKETPRAATTVKASPAARRRRLLLPLALLMLGIALALYAYNFAGRESAGVTASRKPPPEAAVPALPKEVSAGAAVADKAGTLATATSSARPPGEPAARTRAATPSTDLLSGAASAPPVVVAAAPASSGSAGGAAPSAPERAPAPTRASASGTTSYGPPSIPPVASAPGQGAARTPQPARREQETGPVPPGTTTDAMPPTGPARTASAPSDSVAARTSAGHSMVRISGADPEYPRDAVRSGVTSGRVVARVQVDERGNVVDVAIRTSSPSRVFDRAARAALQGWKFRADGEKYEGDVEFNFKLKEE